MAADADTHSTEDVQPIAVRPRHVVLAPDSFKESMSAAEACAAMERGVRRAWPEAFCVWRPMADGGEGTVDAICRASRAEPVDMVVHDALMRPRHATLAWMPDSATAVIEAAQGPGLEHISTTERDIWGATSVGVGEMILHALDLGATRLVIGVGGVATNDAGAGMLGALGVRFLDEDGRPCNVAERGPRALLEVMSVDAGDLDSRLSGVGVVLASDVDNPLLGDRGAAAVFGPQKGATPEDVVLLDDVLERLVDALVLASGESAVDSIAGEKVTPSGARIDRREAPGAGAAGGIGWACLQVLGAHRRPGVEVVAELIGLHDAITEADLVMTGEGSVDAQTLQGKTPWGVTRAAADQGVPVVVLAGRVGAGAEGLLAVGVSALVPIVRETGDLRGVLAEGPANLEAAAEMVCRLIGTEVRS